jgi:heme exporter protein CcmD
VSGDFWGFVVAGYGITILALGGYAIWVVRKGRRLSKRVPPGERRWTST